MAEGFHLAPTRALWELEHDPDHMALTILQLRAYAQAKADYDRIEDAEQFERAVKWNPMVATVRDIEHAIVAEQIARKRAAAIARAQAEEI